MQIAVGFLDFCAVGHLSGRIIMGDFQIWENENDTWRQINPNLVVGIKCEFSRLFGKTTSRESE